MYTPRSVLASALPLFPNNTLRLCNLTLLFRPVARAEPQAVLCWLSVIFVVFMCGTKNSIATSSQPLELTTQFGASLIISYKQHIMCLSPCPPSLPYIRGMGPRISADIRGI